ncbi:hypothetical protein MN608_09616 [Microdochium nivale]|nr:hypothetical protein MN608_09616 [Microdochium nivale]
MRHKLLFGLYVANGLATLTALAGADGIEHGKLYANGTEVIWDLANPDAPPRVIETAMDFQEPLDGGRRRMRRGRRDNEE